MNLKDIIKKKNLILKKYKKKTIILKLKNSSIEGTVNSVKKNNLVILKKLGTILINMSVRLDSPAIVSYKILK